MNFRKILINLVRVLLGVLFIFSGYVKVIDPVGSAIKFGDYFEAFSKYFDMPWIASFEAFSLPFGILLAVAELLIGLCFLLGVHLRLSTYLALAFMLFFTSLTWFLAVTNIVKDCGCFGDAVKLTNWETFYKNLILLPMVLFLFFQRKYMKPFVSPKIELAIFTALVLISFSLAGYTYRYLPLIDFMPYKVGVNILNDMEMPEDATGDVFESTFTYEKNGESATFTLDDLPDSTWNFVETHNVLIKEGYVAPTKDFSIADTTGYIQDQVLSKPGYLVMMTIPKLHEAKLNHLDQFVDIQKWALSHSGFYVLSGASITSTTQILKEAGANFDVYQTDETVLKSMVRSNPGLLLLKDGVILSKWNNNDLPSIEKLDMLTKMETASDIIASHNSAEKWITRIFMLLTGLLFILCSVIRFADDGDEEETN